MSGNIYWLREPGDFVKLELREAFLRETGLVLNASDLRLGLSFGLISPSTAVSLALDAVKNGSTDPALQQVARTGRDDFASIRDSLSAIDSDDIDLFSPRSVRKWTYLEFKAAYELRDRLADPFGIVEALYADFGYPTSVAAFVRYMPAPPGALGGDNAMYEQWERYLTAEAAELMEHDERP